MSQFWEVCAKLISRGDNIVSPMTLEPALQYDSSIPYSWEYWSRYGKKMLGICNKLVVVKLPGWDTSVGVQGEIEIAKQLGLEIEYYDYT